jgi:hypothetical protein
VEGGVSLIFSYKLVVCGSVILGREAGLGRKEFVGRRHVRESKQMHIQR